MGKLQKQFESKYGFDAVNFIKQLGNRYLGMIKTIGLNSAMVSYADEIGLKIPINETYRNKPSDSFLIDLIQAIAEAGQKFPENQKVSFDNLVGEAEVSSIDVSVPKSKGVLEDFKDIVADDELRPVMNGVFVSPNGFLIGTDAHKLVKLKNSTFSKDADKIIDLNAYIKSKGDVLRFIDGKYPNYDAVIPRDNPNKVKDIPTYAFYNFCKSAVALKKLQDSDIFNVNFNEKGENFSFNPILFAELLGFALAKGFNTFDLQFSNSTRAFLLNFEGGSEGVIMPIYNKDGLVGTKPYTFDEVISQFGNGGKAKASKPKALPKQGEQKQSKKEEPYKKYEGSLDDVTYIPRRDISMIILKNGDELTNADIIDGVYRLKKKFAKGGEVESTIDILMTEEPKVWDKFDFNSGGEIRASKEKTKKYAEELEKVFSKKGIKRGSLSEKIYEELQDENFHLLNEFLTRNGYFKKATNDKLIKTYENPIYVGAYADKDSITIQDKANSNPKPTTKKKIQRKKLSARTKYIPNRDIKEIELKSGEEIAGSKIVDGFYKKK